MSKKKLTMVVPAYNEEEALPIFYEEAHRVEEEISGVEIEYLFIDDGSSDKTLEVLRSLHKKDARVRYVSFSRNFGKEAAIYAGLQNATGDYVAILDADLQDPPSLLPEMLQAMEEEGYDGARDFQLMNRKVVNAILSMGEYNRFSKGIFGWVGFRKKWLEYENIERSAGETKWSFWKLFLYALDGIVAFSTAPLVMASVMGMVFCLVAFVAIIFIIIRTVLFGDPTSGWPSMVCIIMFIAGVQLLCMGILGQYMAKTYLETKKRPLYLVEETEEEA